MFGSDINETVDYKYVFLIKGVFDLLNIKVKYWVVWFIQIEFFLEKSNFCVLFG